VQNVGPAGASGLFVLLLRCNQMLINVCVVTSSKKKPDRRCTIHVPRSPSGANYVTLLPLINLLLNTDLCISN
jgi:hypothetical protein